MIVRVFYHDKCFDGACSASLFSRLYHERVDGKAKFEFHGLVHRAGALFNEADFTGDVNAIVDFKYSASPKIQWWFDHHQSAFLTAEDAAHFKEQKSSTKFYDPDCKSCTKLIAGVGEERFQFDTAPVADMVHWADTIDGASFASAKEAVELKAPAMRITMVIEATQDPTFVPRLIPYLSSQSLSQTVEEPFVAEKLPPLLDRHWKSIDILRERTESKDRVVYFDVTDYDLEGYNKFIPYYLHPECVYSVGLSKSSFRTKVSVGSNPWTTAENLTNLAKICERYGGGGHARVGAISFPPTEFERARKAAAEIVAELRAYAREHH
ncbi:MAG: phosphoesterase [Terriglobia bacterium]|nr:phosphoesterase [Terriglobia bacterium]